MYTLYIGENKNWFELLNHLLDSKLIYTDSPFKARSYIFEHFYNLQKPVFIFIELSDTEKTTKYISGLKKNKTSNQYLILVGENIPQHLIVGYMQNGIDEIITPKIQTENLQKLLSVLPRLSQYKGNENTIATFQLPLWKRSFDIVFASSAIIILSPLLLVTALAIRLESTGPVIYTSQRVGSNYKIFGFLKFRSMYKDADKRLKDFQSLNQYQEQTGEFKAPEKSTETSTIFVGDDFHLTEQEYMNRRKKLKENNFIKLQNDPRITKMGRFIRKYSIDELPQLINILKGDMSIVGNRPLPLYEAELLTSDEYIERFMAPSGLTGLWQVEKRGTEGILSPEERKQLDIRYARKFSFLLDMKIIFRTFTAFVQKENV